MNRDIIFVRFPAFPWRPAMFRPDALLARQAAECTERGAPATVLDFSTVEFWERVFPQALRPTLAHHWDRLRHWPSWLRLEQTRRLDRRLPGGLFASAKAAGEEAAKHGLLRQTGATVVVQAHSRFELAAAEAFARALRRRAPRARRVLSSPMPRKRRRGVMGRLDTLFHEEQNRLSLCSILKERSGMVGPSTEVYGRDMYPGLYMDTQVKLFDICSDFEHSVRLTKALGWATRIADAGKPSAIIRADWASEAAALHSRFGVRTFFRRRLTGGVSDWAGELQPRRRQTGWQYGMTVDGQFEGEVWARAHAAGCRILGVSCGTGSQRLLEKTCGPDARVSRSARLLQTASSAGCFTHASFTYPTSCDDYHTRDETLRFIKKTRPDGVSISYSGADVKTSTEDWEEHLSLLNDIEQCGVSPAWSADEVLALRAGEAAGGTNLAEETNWALATGDGAALSAAVTLMNRGLQSVLLGPAAETWRDAAGQG